MLRTPTPCEGGHCCSPLMCSCEGAAGLSLGEYTALVFAGAITLPAALALVKVRADAMQRCADAHKVSSHGKQQWLG